MTTDKRDIYKLFFEVKTRIGVGIKSKESQA
jgi:hypothetical protein